MRSIDKIVELARWAPSGDNTQPWRFEIIADDRLVIHGSDTREHCVYDLDGHPSQMAHGALIETLRIAATAFGLRADWRRRPGTADTACLYDVTLVADAGITEDPLFPFITTRCVQRRAMSPRAIGAVERSALETAAAPCTVQWYDSFADRWRLARLNFANAHLRLTLREAYEVHTRIIEWGAKFSLDRIPEEALGVDPMTAKLMRWIMQSWQRVEFFNTWLAGTLAPRIQLDVVPSLACGAHALLVHPEEPRTIDDFVAIGQSMQRFWLTAESLQLRLQPEMTPLIFSRYSREGQRFSSSRRAEGEAGRLSGKLDAIFGAPVARRAGFLCRLGYGARARARSLRVEAHENR